MSVKRIVLISLMAVLISICSWITIPSTVPFTMQTFAVFCSLVLLGGRDGLVAILLYVVLGAIGVPVFSNFQGGIGHLLGPTGGYIIGFIATGIIYFLFELIFKKYEGRKRIAFEIFALTLGLIACYLIGTIWFYVITKGESYSFFKILLICVIPYIIPDLIKLGLAFVIFIKLKKIIFKEENDYE